MISAWLRGFAAALLIAQRLPTLPDPHLILKRLNPRCSTVSHGFKLISGLCRHKLHPCPAFASEIASASRILLPQVAQIRFDEPRAP
jgi:hypothetical protein